MVYWGIVLFGYDTYVPPLSLRPLYALTAPPSSGIGGGVVSQDYFKTHFGLVNPDGSANKHKSDNVSSNVVSVLQAGAFFGALGSAPISGELFHSFLALHVAPILCARGVATVDARAWYAWRGWVRWSVRLHAPSAELTSQARVRRARF